MACIILLLLTGTDHSVPVSHCHVVELNTTERFQQVIFWRHYGREIHVAQWCMSCKIYPLRKGALLIVDQGRYYKVTYDKLRRSYTSFDPEEKDRDLLPVRDRIPLWRY